MTFSIAADDDAGFRRSRKKKLAQDRRQSLLFRALKAKFSSPEEILRKLGMDQNLLAKDSRSVSRDDMEDDGMMFDMAPIKEYLEARGVSGDDWHHFLSLMPKHMQGDEMSDEEAEEAAAQHGHSDLGRPEDRGQQASRQRNLESAERETAPRHEEDDMRARETEHRVSTQSEDRRRYARDRIPKNHINGNGRGGHMAADAEFDALINRVGTEMSCGGLLRDRSTGPTNLETDADWRGGIIEMMRQMEGAK